MRYCGQIGTLKGRFGSLRPEQYEYRSGRESQPRAASTSSLDAGRSDSSLHRNRGKRGFFQLTGL